MSVETFGFIGDLNRNLPAGTDTKDEGDNHIRGIKGTLLDQFPNLTAVVNANAADLNILQGLAALGLSGTELNYVNGVTSAIQTQLNALTAAIAAAQVHHGALVLAAVTTSIPTGTPTKIPFTSESYDTDSIHDNAVNNTRLTVPAGVSYVRLSAFIQYAGSMLPNTSTVEILKNNAAFAGMGESHQISAIAGTSNDPAHNITSAIVPVTPGDYFEVRVTQDSGGAINVVGGGAQTWFAMEIVE